ncbi:hypothetical protein BaRGS_00034950, partial [Batillaria attramentaria]
MDEDRKRVVQDYVANLPKRSSSSSLSREQVSLKVLLIGDPMVGKTSLVQRYVNGKFLHHYKATFGVDYRVKVLRWSDDKDVQLQLWDIAGTEQMSAVTRAYYKNANGCLLLFDLTELSTFTSVPRWKEELDSKGGTDVPCLLLGNKCDLEGWAVSEDSMRQISFCNFIGCRKISVKENVGVDDAF